MKSLPPFLRRLTRMYSVTWASEYPVRPSVPARDLRLAFFRLCLLTSVLSLCGCTLGPTVETRYVIVHPGQPMRAMQNQTVDGERMDGAGVVHQDIGGWVMMPPDHWAVLEKIIRQSQSAVLQPLPPSPAK